MNPCRRHSQASQEIAEFLEKACTNIRFLNPCQDFLHIEFFDGLSCQSPNLIKTFDGAPTSMAPLVLSGRSLLSERA